MRILQVDLDSKRLELHPYVSVVTGLSGASRERVLEVLAGLPAGDAAGARGLVEAHGVLLDLDPATLALLDLKPAGDHAAAIDSVVRADQLPGASLGPVARERAELLRRRESVLDALRSAEAAANHAAAAHATSQEALDALGAAAPTDAASATSLAAPRAAVEERRADRETAEQAVAAAQERLARAKDDEQVAQRAVDEARAHRNDLARGGAAAAAALEGARGGRDPFAAAALDAAHERVAELERELAADASTDAPATGSAATGADLDERIAALETHRQSLEASLLALDAVDPFAVEVALAQLESDDDAGERVPSAEAQSLADEWVALEGRLRNAGSSGDDDPTTLVSARRRLDEARVAVFESERAVRLPDISREDAQALEDLHDVVLGAQDKNEKRFASGKARQKLDEARAAEQAILDRLGFLTYADFVMGTSILNVDPEKEQVLDETRAELAQAEDELARLEAGVDAELALAERRNQQKELRGRVVALLGRDPGDDVEWALRQVRVPAEAGAGRHDRLHQALEMAGVVLQGEDPPPRLLVELAHVWLDEQRSTAEQRSRIEGELSTTDGELAALRADAADDAGAAWDQAERRRRNEARLEEARAALATAEARVEQHASAEIDVARSKVELEHSVAAEEQASAGVSGLEEAATNAAAVVHGRESEMAAALAARDLALRAERDAIDELAVLTAQLEATSNLTDRPAREEAVARASASAEAAAAELARVRADAATIESSIATLPDASDDDAAQDASMEELEWYLLSRLAAQRSVSYAGSVPFVLDDALAGLPGESLQHLLDRLERMAAAVQVIVLSDDAHISLWADHAGPERAAIVSLEPV